MRLGLILIVVTMAVGPATAGVAGTTPTPKLVWSTYANLQYGYTLNYPIVWQAEPGPAGYLSLTNFRMQPLGTDVLPPHGCKLELLPDVPAELITGKPFAVGREDYPGLIRIGGEDPLSTSPPSHSIQIVYQAAGRHWGLFGYFAEPVDQRNPNVAVFFAIVHSIHHQPVT